LVRNTLQSTGGFTIGREDRKPGSSTELPRR
jgi:hypothetical protein